VNSNLYDTTTGEVLIPKEIKQHLTNSFAQARTADQNTEGFRRNQELQSQEKITYKQLKRIKNFFDNFKGKPTELPFILNGGVLMRNWVNNTLTNMRNNTQTNQQDTQPADPTVKSNELKTNVQNLARPSQEHKRTSQRHATATYEQTVVESLRRINELISKI
jgi:hypothetical protein